MPGCEQGTIHQASVAGFHRIRNDRFACHGKGNQSGGFSGKCFISRAKTSRHHPIKLPHPCDHIHPGKFFLNFFPVLLRPATANHQNLSGFVIDERLQGFFAVTAGGINKTTTVQHPDISIIQIIHRLHTMQCKPSEQGFGIHQIFIATKSRAIDFHFRSEAHGWIHPSPSWASGKSSGPIKTSRALLPVKGPTTPASSSMSIRRPARV